VLRSVISFHGDVRTVGYVPPDVAASDEAVIVTDLKRMLGNADGRDLPPPVEADPETGRPVVQVGDQRVTPEELVGMLLSTVRERVSMETGENIVDAVLSVPGFSANAQRQATIDAGRLAGLNVLKIMNETAAVAVAFNARNPSDDPRNVVVFDLGAGKLDVSLSKFEGNVCTIVKTTGNMRLGGGDIDDKLFEHFKGELGDLQSSKAACRRLREECERAKIALSSQLSTRLLNRDFPRSEFEQICSGIFNSCLEPLTELFTECPVPRSDVTNVVIVGGSTKIPRLRQMISDFFGEDIELIDADANNLAVVDGVALQGAVMKGFTDGVSIKNSTPLSLGISLANGTNHILVPRCTILPAKASVTATTFRDDQPNVGFDIVQGERMMARDCLKLGHVTVEGIERAKRGVPKIKVEMELDDDGILVVTGRDLTTMATVSAKVENQGNLSRQAIEKLLAEAETEKGRDPYLRAREEAKCDLRFFLDRAEAAFTAELRKRKISFADQEKYRSIIENCRGWMTDHPRDRSMAYRFKCDQVRRFLNEIVAVR
jgi:L1 cell adhesion molecule like protein